MTTIGDIPGNATVGSLSWPHWRVDICLERPFDLALRGLHRFALGGSSKTAPWEYSSFALWGLIGFAF